MNNSYGHLFGDFVLTKLGTLTTQTIWATDCIYRYGGEEFTILLPETRLQKACLVGERIRDSIRSQIFEPVPGSKTSVTVSLGATELVKGEDFRSFIDRADKAMYKSKETGRNKLTYIIS